MTSEGCRSWYNSCCSRICSQPEAGSGNKLQKLSKICRKAWTMDELESQLLENHRKYVSYNQLRIERLLTLMPTKKQPLYHALPFLLNVNDPAFPGYIKDSQAVSGVFRYTPDQMAIKAIYKLFPAAKSKEITVPEPSDCVIKSLLLMGSLGTIAQNHGSDFDFWVCVSLDKLTGEQIKCLEQKLLALEEWAEHAHNLEVHFFITDIKSVRTNKFGEADKESAGSSQAKLLKEEFYRTTIYVAGKIPFWWLIPPEISNDEYKKYKGAIKKSVKLKPDQLIDLGHLNEISSDEFFGAAIWQICKAMDSPYKSVLKMAMLAVFLDPDRNHRLLCDSIKLRVQAPDANQENPRYYDPYTILFDTILAYYKTKEQPETLDLFQTCLYIKSGIKAGKGLPEESSMNFKQKIVAEYIKSWKWNKSRLQDLDSFKDWDFEKVRNLGNRVHKFLIDAYQTLSRMLKEDGNSKQTINPQDITVIGRKLESFYSVKPGKINFMKRAFAEGLLQESITIIADYNKPQNQLWSVYRGQIKERSLNEADTQLRLLKKGRNLVEILVWAIFNRLVDNNTSIYLLPNPSPVTMQDIQDFVNQFMELFPATKISSISNEDLLAKDKKLAYYFVVNFGTQKWKTEIEKATVIYKNSWGELFCLSEEQHGKGFLSKFMQSISATEDNIEESESKFQYFIPKGKNCRPLKNTLDDIVNTSYLSSVKEA